MRKRALTAGLTAAAAVVLIGVGLAVFRPAPRATAAEIMERGVKAAANVTSIHLVGRLRTLPADNFGQIGLEDSFQKMEIWKQFTEPYAWRVEKPMRVIAMDGQRVTMYIRPLNVGVRIEQPTPGALDAGWLVQLVDIGQTLSHHLKVAADRGIQLSCGYTTDEHGRQVVRVTMTIPADIPEGDYLRNKFITGAETVRSFIFDTATDRLVGMEIDVVDAGERKLIFEATQIEYDADMPASTFQLDLPENVQWHEEPQVLPNNAKYEKMTPAEAARAFFEACASEDWQTVDDLFGMHVDGGLKAHLGRLEIIKLGEPFRSSGYGGWFVPYEIKLSNGEVKTHNLAVRNDNPAKRYVVDGGI